MKLCQKKYHDNPKDAMKQAVQLAKHGKAKGKTLRVYQCDICGGFHVTSQPLK